jgi:hypothetical protein
MSNIELDTEQSRRLAEAEQMHPCAYADVAKPPEAPPSLRDAVLREAGVSTP